ncbi:MAG TPA: hypothetical protein VJV77_07270 [Casimicrobiaceae bacterium]|nr:hypothetical protein [Casimicrobiaceae bacterium]
MNKNGEHLCTAGSADVWTFSGGVWSDATAQEVANLDVMGSAGALDDAVHDFLIWACPHELAFGDTIDLFFEADDRSNPPGTVFVAGEEENPEPAFDWSDPPTEEQIRTLESRDAINKNVMWSVTVNQLQRFELQPDAVRQHLALHFLWNSRSPQRLRVSISRKSIREIVTRSEGEELLLDYLPVGSTLRVAIGA